MLSIFNRECSWVNKKSLHSVKKEINHSKNWNDILNYWLTIDLFDLPECPLENKKNLLSIDATDFQSEMDKLVERVIENPKILNEESRLTIMFQCHRAGYILLEKEEKSNHKIPLTFLVSHNFIPQFDKENNVLTWRFSEDDSDTKINFATLYTLFEKCPPENVCHQSFSQWREDRNDAIKALLVHHFHNGENLGMETATFKQKVIDFNRAIAKEFWEYKNAQDFMDMYCNNLELDFEPLISKKDQPHFLPKEGLLTFRWRFCFYDKKPEIQQIGPFFKDDLDYCLNELKNNNLSKPLQYYLSGCTQPKELPNATDNGHIYFPLTKNIPCGRWASNPKYGLSLMQTVAVNAALSEDPIIAVNGPPGTGKTTLLKDIIAIQLVERTLKLVELCNNEAWFSDPKSHQLIMQYSMIVASSNNKAVENISKELPDRNSIDEEFQNKISHFSYSENNWGLFCAVLGNSKNRREFKESLNELQRFLKNKNDIFNQNSLVFRSKCSEENSKVIINFVRDVIKKKQLSLLISDWKSCSNFEKYSAFTKPFISALIAIEKEELSETDFLEKLKNMTNSEWEEAIEALDKLKKQWFGKKCYQKHHSEEFKCADNHLKLCLKRYQDCLKLNDLDEKTHLLNVSSYQKQPDEDRDVKEKRLQQSSPFSSESVNRIRSELFCAAIVWNEAFLKRSSEQFDEKLWKDLQNLIDGNLQGNENKPYYAKLWSLLFLFFPVVSTSLSSVANQFKLMKKASVFGTVFIDEAGQAVNYHIVGLLQRCRKAIVVGDPIQLEPVVTLLPQIDRSIAKKFLTLSDTYGEVSDCESSFWAESYIVSASSAQSIADRAGCYYANIGKRKVGIPLFVHRRCEEPMFSIANKIAYDNKMVFATYVKPVSSVVRNSSWINVTETGQLGSNYYNIKEAETAIALIEYLATQYPQMLDGGVFIITPFTQMKECLAEQWRTKATEKHQLAFGKGLQNKALADFAKDNIGTVHTFQGKEASVVILCLGASAARGKSGGITWVNSKPNLLNVAVTRAKKYLFVIGNIEDWKPGQYSSEMQNDDMELYNSFEDFIQEKSKGKLNFDFGI